MLAAAQALLGQDSEARQAASLLTALAPELTEEKLRNFLGEPMAERYMEGLRLAGWRG